MSNWNIDKADSSVQSEYGAASVRNLLSQMIDVSEWNDQALIAYAQSHNYLENLDGVSPGLSPQEIRLIDVHIDAMAMVSGAPCTFSNAPIEDIKRAHSLYGLMAAEYIESHIDGCTGRILFPSYPAIVTPEEQRAIRFALSLKDDMATAHLLDDAVIEGLASLYNQLGKDRK